MCMFVCVCVPTPVPPPPPLRQEFDGQLRRLESLVEKLADMPSTVHCGCLSIDVQGMVVALRAEVCTCLCGCVGALAEAPHRGQVAKWTYALVSEIEAFVSDRLDEMVGFMKSTHVRYLALCPPLGPCHPLSVPHARPPLTSVVWCPSSRCCHRTAAPASPGPPPCWMRS